MNIIVVGLGSMGRRRVRLLKRMNKEYEIFGVDQKKERRLKTEREFGIKTYNTLDMALVDKKPQCAIISTSPLSHANIIETCLLHDCNVFTELNLVDDKYDTNIQLAHEKGKVLFISSTELYRDEICYIRNKVFKSKCKLNYVYHIGQYLPDWHPWESIQDYFVADKKTNGCREILAIELPWIIKSFGDIESFEVLSSKNTNLSIQYNDNYLLLLKHSNGNKGIMVVDVVSRKAVRNLEVYGEDIYISWDGTPTGLVEYDIENKTDKVIDLYKTVDKQDGYASFIVENAYLNELKFFFDIINNVGQAEYTFEDDIKVLSLIDRIESGEKL